MSNKMVNLQHFIFTPKYRRAIFADQAVAKECEDRIRYICDKQNITIRALAVMPDHVHAFVELPRTMSVAKGAYWMKWFSSNHVRRVFPHLKSIHDRAMWGHRYFHRSVGGDSNIVRKYITNQIGEYHEE